MSQKQTNFLLRTAYAAVWTALLYLAARYLLLWLLPFLIALALSAAAEPAIDFCRRKMRFKRAFTAAVLGGIGSLPGSPHPKPASAAP